MKIKLYLAIKKLTLAFLLIFLILAGVGVFIYLYEKLCPRKIYVLNIVRNPELIREYYKLLYGPLSSMVISGILGVIILIFPVLALSAKVKSLQAGYIKQEYKRNRDFVIIRKKPTTEVDTSKFYYP